MKLPSLSHIAQKTTATLKRFPLAIISASLAACLSIYLVEFPDLEAKKLYKTILLASLGIPLFTVIPLVITYFVILYLYTGKIILQQA